MNGKSKSDKSLPRVLLVDDDHAICAAVADYLEQHSLLVSCAGSGAEAESMFLRCAPSVAVIDYKLPDGDALTLIPRLRALSAEVPIIVLTGHGSIDVAVRAIKAGAEHFLTKPIELSALLVILNRCLESSRLSRTSSANRKHIERRKADPFIGSSAAVQQLAQEARLVANAGRPILILGETGVGKGVLAHWLHEHGARSEEAFVDLNCAGLSREFLESELFGYEKGAFTGAVSAKPGLLEVAHRGTAFLDELGDMDLEVQPRLLKALEEQSIRRLGEVRERTVDVSLIAATHHDLAERVAQGRFRQDLYFRLNTLQLRIPALRERREDIVPIANSLLQGLANDLGRGEARLATESKQALTAHDWFGNIRELRNVLERALLFADSGLITTRELRFEQPNTKDAAFAGSRLTLNELETRHIECVLEQEGGHVERAATRLGVPRSTLYQRIKSIGLDPSRFQTASTDHRT